MPAARRIIIFCVLLCASLPIPSAAEDQEQPFPKEYDFRYTTFEDLEEDNSTFQIYTHPDIVGSVQATIDSAHDQLIVGAREQLWRFSLQDLSLKENVEWKSADTDSCVFRGQQKSDCYNFIKILLVHKDEVLVCGTNAFNPMCTWRAADNLTAISDTIINGQGFCPFNPHHNSTGIITSQRDYISATSVDSAERDPVIYRILPSDSRLRTQQNSKWLNEPHFVSAYEVDNFIYFFFREVATEYINCGKRIYARVARVCKTDKGAGGMLFKDYWTTYLKARLNCSIPGEYPFYFDELQSTYLLQSNNESLLYGVFTTPDNALAGSAVCVFNMSAFTTSFAGPFKYQEGARYAWERHANKESSLQKCPESSTLKRSFQQTPMEDHSQYQMMDDAVQPHTLSPVLLGPSERWSHVVADTVAGKTGTFNVIFVASTTGVIRKMLNLPTEKEPCLIEEIKVTPNGDFKPIKQLRISKEHNALYVFILNKVMRIPLHRCDRFSSEELCLNAMDPYCGWDSGESRCSPAPNGDPSLSFWKQDVSSCPVHKHPVDGQWSNWSAWTSCSQAGSNPSQGNCLCRLRSCDDPPALYGGKACEGSAVEVANCTIHGQWSEWTSWSKCSTTCGNGQQTRSRSCTSPPPMNGGEDCKPLSRDEEFKASVRPFCVGNPACPEPPVDGNWSAWSPWSDCTAKCNGGMQTRRRSCSNPLPQRGGQSCAGNIKEWRMCNSYTCTDEQKLTQWTPWSNINQTASGYWVQRYRFACSASVPDPKLITTSHVKTHTRFCTNSTCYKPDTLDFNSSVDGDWSTWSTWSRCSADCGTGQRWRSRSCDNPEPVGFGQDCLGTSSEFATCNEQECLATWGPWSVYSTCSVSCGSGTRIRFRSCQIPYVGFNSSLDIACVGISEESEPCIQQVCNDTGLWDVWSAWSDCTSDRVQFRHRACLEHTPEECRGQNVEVQPCFFLGAGTVLKQTSMGYRREYTMIHLTVVGCAAFFMGVVICVGIYLCFHNWKSIRSYDLQKPANENVYDKPRFGSFASQLSLDFLTVNNKVYDSCTLSSRGTAVIKDNTFRKDKYNKNFPENMYATIRTNHSLRTEV